MQQVLNRCKLSFLIIVYIIYPIWHSTSRYWAKCGKQPRTQTTDYRWDAIHYLARVPANKRLKSRRSFLGETVPIGADNTRVKLWGEAYQPTNSNIYVSKSKRGSSTCRGRTEALIVAVLIALSTHYQVSHYQRCPTGRTEDVDSGAC